MLREEEVSYVQGSVKEWSLGSVTHAPSARGGQDAEIMHLGNILYRQGEGGSEASVVDTNEERTNPLSVILSPWTKNNLVRPYPKKAQVPIPGLGIILSGQIGKKSQVPISGQFCCPHRAALVC